MLNAKQMSDIVKDTRKALKINDYHSAIHRLTVVMDNLIARVPNPDTPPPAPSDDVYRVECKWLDGPPPCRHGVGICEPFAIEYDPNVRTIGVLLHATGMVRIPNGVEISLRHILRHAGPLPTGGE